MDISPLLLAYEELIARFDQQVRLEAQENCCGRKESACCRQPFDLLLIESMHLSQAINTTLRQEKRQAVIERASTLARRLRELHHRHPALATDQLAAAFPEEMLNCPLLEAGDCLMFADRPPRCRYRAQFTTEEQSREIFQAMADLSQQAYQFLTGKVPPKAQLRFSSADTISGKFVQLYFQAMTGENG
jgi:hypothetical protein